jgi:hypothetical protein
MKRKLIPLLIVAILIITFSFGYTEAVNLTEEYYFNAYDAGATWATNPANMVDGTDASYASTVVNNDVQLLNTNNATGTDLGEILSVEIRAFGYYSANDQVTLTPIFTGGTGDGHIGAVPATTGAWGVWFDITTDTNAPGTWTWADIVNLDTNVQYVKSGGAQTTYVGEVEIRVNYTANTAPVVSNMSLSDYTIKGGDTITLYVNSTHHDVNDTDGDTLYLYCDELGTPTAATTNCTGGTTTDTTDPYDFTCTYAALADDANHTIFCSIYDGTTYSSVVNESVVTDSTAPSLSVNSVAGDTSASYYDTINDVKTDINITGEAGMSCRWSSGDASYSAMSSACTVQGDTANCSVTDVLSQGFQTRYISCQDTLTNENTASTNLDVSFYLDYTAPTTSDNSVSTVQTPPYVVTITETDNVDGDPLTYYCVDTANSCDPGTLIDNGGTVTFTTADRGINYLRYNSTDDAGNQQTTVNKSIQINQLPVLTSATDDTTTNGSSSTINVSTISYDSDSGQEMTLWVCNSTASSASGCSDTEYCNYTETGNNSCTFTSEAATGTYNWYAFIYDASDEAATGNPKTGSYIIDADNPVITINNPTDSTTYTQNSLAFTITVDESLTNAWYNINGTENVSLSNTTAVEWTHTNTSIDDGNYNVTFYANDSYGNEVSSSTITFIIDTSVADTTAPAVSVWSPVNNTYYISTSILLNITTDENASWAGYTNNSDTLTILENTSETNWNKTINLGEGEHNVTFYANDSSNNQGNESVTFWVDINNASITDFACDDNFNDSQNITCRANFTDAVALNYAIIGYNATGSWVNCTQANILGTSNSTSCIVDATDTSPGNFTAEVYIFDQTNQFNTSSIEVNVSDDTYPTIDNISYAPNTTDNLDPDVGINVSSDITEDYSISTVVLMYQNTTDTDWTLVTMTNTSATKYNASFTPSNGTYTFAINATDSQGNQNISYNNTVIVQNDTSTNITTTITTIKSYTQAQAADNITLGDVILNNTGDGAINFTVNLSASDSIINKLSVNYTLNQSEIYAVSAGNELNISIEANTTSLPVGLYPYNVSVTYNPTIIYERNLNIQSADGPYLEVSITNYSSTVDVGDELTLVTQVDNLGTADATGVNLTWSLPADWTVNSGSANRELGNLQIGGTATNTITVTVGSTQGDTTIAATASGTNAASNSVSKDVTVGIASTTVSTGDGSDGGGSSGGGGGGASTSEYRQTSEILEIVRGTTKEFPITINNIYKDAVIDNVTVTTQGYFPQHIKIRPESLSGIQYGKNKTLNLIIYAPDYLDQGNYSLKLTIKGSIVQNDITKTLTDKRALTIIIQEYDREEVLLCQNESIQYIEEMKFENFSTAKVEKLLANLDTAINTRDNNLALGYCTQIQEAKVNAFLTAGLILEVMKGVDEAEDKRLEIPETKELLSLAKAAFDREDYETAQDRIKDAQMSLFLETKGRINLLWFLMTYWWLIIIAILSLAATAYFIYKEILGDIINRKIKNLRKEEGAIRKLIKAAQRKTYDLKKMSGGEYHKVVASYETRLNKIKQDRAKLRHRRVALLSKEEEIKDINKEHKDITNLIKNTQRKYFEKGKISRQRYLKDTAGHEERLAEIEEERTTLETKVAREKQEPKLFPLDYIKNIFKSKKQIKLPKKIKLKKRSKLERDVMLKAAIREAKKPLFKKLKLRKLKLKKTSVSTRQKTSLTKEQKKEYDDHLRRLGLKIK